jgi:hypothetical protein
MRPRFASASATKSSPRSIERGKLSIPPYANDFGGDGVFDALRGLHDDGVLTSDDLQFRVLTLSHDVAARRSGGAGT